MSNGVHKGNGQVKDGRNESSYYYCKSSSMELVYTTVGRQLELVTEKKPNHIAISSVQQAIKKTYKELNDEANVLAANLLGLGLNKGDRVGIWGRNSYEWMVMEFALAKAGIILVTICPAYQSEELEYALGHVQCSALLMQDNLESIDYYKILCDIEPDIANNDSKMLNSKILPHLKHIILVSDTPKRGTLDFKELLRKPSQSLNDQLTDIKVQPDDPFCIQFTSGTTGRSKAAVVTHFQCINLGRGIRSRFAFDESLSLLLQVPLYHALGSVIGVCTILACEGTGVIPSARYNSIASLEAIEKERCTVMLAAPTMIIDMISKPELNSIDISSLQSMGLGGSFCQRDLIEKASKLLNIKVLVGYGCTETSGVITGYDPNDKSTHLHDTVGKPLDLLEVKITDEKGNIVLNGEEGEILVRGYNVFLGYWGDEDKTKEVLTPDRWYHTGDLGKLDKDGYLFIVGRQKDMVIRGGENIYPAEVEQFLTKHSAVKDAQVIGVPDPKMVEEACAWIILKPGINITQEEIREYCKGKITHFKIPKYVLFADSFPMTVSGKVQKFKLRQMALQKLNLM